MKLLYRRCAGLDVHKKTVSVCVRRRVAGKSEAEVEEAVFGTFTRDLERLGKWLKERKVRQVAMESTGVYWIPVWNILEQSRWKLELTLVNPAAVHAMQGRKTDRIDARRIAEFLQYGLLHGSFIPPRPVRQLRELTRLRTHIQAERNRVINRIGRLLETVNVKLGSVASDIVGKSGRVILQRLAQGSGNAAELAHLVYGQLKKKIPDLVQALEGITDEHFQWMLRGMLRRLQALDTELSEIDARLCEKYAAHEDLLRRLCTIPGVERTTARVLLAELGTDMSVFPTAEHAASWAGLCPGNAKSAGKRFSGRTRKGNRYLRRILVQSGWAAARQSDCYLAACFRRVGHRRGMKRAVVGVAHRILRIAWAIIRNGGEYYERGGDHFDQLNPARTARKLLRRLERIGLEVEIRPRLGRPPGAKNRPKAQFQNDYGIAPRTPMPPVMPEGACRKCWKAGIAECIHLIRRPRKNKPIIPTADLDSAT
jgi:transposase